MALAVPNRVVGFFFSLFSSEPTFFFPREKKGHFFYPSEKSLPLYPRSLER